MQEKINLLILNPYYEGVFFYFLFVFFWMFIPFAWGNNNASLQKVILNCTQSQLFEV